MVNTWEHSLTKERLKHLTSFDCTLLRFVVAALKDRFIGMRHNLQTTYLPAATKVKTNEAAAKVCIGASAVENWKTEEI